MKRICLLLATASLYAVVQADPILPRWISADTYGYGYVMTLDRNNTLDYVGYLEMSWDFDYNCVRNAWSIYSDRSWGELSYCNGLYKEYTSVENNCTTESVGHYPLEQAFNQYLSKFSQWYSGTYSDPVWDEGSYSVSGHEDYRSYIYYREEDDVIEFIVDATQTDVDYVIYFPEGLTLDQRAFGVWDYEHRYSYCPANKAESTQKLISFLSGGKLNNNLHAKQLFNKPSTNERVNNRSKPTLGGVRALFANPNKQQQTLIDKKAFKVYDFTQSNEAESKVKNLMSLNQFGRRQQNFNKNIHGEVLKSLALADANSDGVLTKEEVWNALENQNMNNHFIDQAQFEFVFTSIDQFPMDGKLTRFEIDQFYRIQ